jgi:hypothetical protein
MVVERRSQGGDCPREEDDEGPNLLVGSEKQHWKCLKQLVLKDRMG